jgi:hypothetical protein
MEQALAVGSYTWLMARARRLAQGSAPELAPFAPQNLQQHINLISEIKNQPHGTLPVWHDFV